MQQTAAAFDPMFADSLAITMTDDAEEAVHAHFEGQAALDKFSMVPGRYWRIASDFHGHPLFKKEPAPDVDDSEIFLAFSPSMTGWVITAAPWAVSDANTIAWAKCSSPAEPYPQGVFHIPFWAKKPCPLVGSALRTHVLTSKFSSSFHRHSYK